VPKEGWICPRCYAVFAPFMVECSYCNRGLKQSASASAVDLVSGEERARETAKRDRTQK